MKQIKFPNFVQHALKGAALESVAKMPAHPVEGRIVLDKTGGANDGQAVMYSGAAWSPLVRGGSGSGLDADTLDGYHLGGLSALGSTQPYIPLVKTDGVMEIGRYVDFHAVNEDSQDHTVRLRSDPSTPGELYIQSNKIWHEGTLPASYASLSYGAGFANPASATEQSLRCSKVGVTVFLEGQFFYGSGVDSDVWFFNLPAGYRPQKNVSVFIRSYEAPTDSCKLTIAPDGGVFVTVLEAPAGLLRACSLSGIHFTTV